MDANLSSIRKLFLILLCLLTLPWDLKADAVTSFCSTNQYLVKKHNRSGYFRSDGVYVSPSVVSAHCRDYRSFRSAEIHFPTKISKVDLSKKRFKRFSKEEKRKIRDAFKKIPRILTDFGKITFYRQKEGIVRNNPAVTNPKKKEIILYDSIFQHNIERVLAHELAHILYERLSDKERNSYKLVAKWENREIKGEKITINTRQVFTAIDGIFSPDEDFANNIEYYLFDEKTLQKKNKEIYQ